VFENLAIGYVTLDVGKILSAHHRAEEDESDLLEILFIITTDLLTLNKYNPRLQHGCVAPR
jgi:hypothetical protein